MNCYDAKDLHLNSASNPPSCRTFRIECLISNFGTVAAENISLLAEKLPTIVPFEMGSSSGLELSVTYRERGFELVFCIIDTISINVNWASVEDLWPLGTSGISSKVAGAIEVSKVEAGATTPGDMPMTCRA